MGREWIADVVIGGTRWQHWIADAHDAADALEQTYELVGDVGYAQSTSIDVRPVDDVDRDLEAVVDVLRAKFPDVSRERARAALLSVLGRDDPIRLPGVRTVVRGTGL